MADNASVVSEATTVKFIAAADEVTYSGDTTKVQLVRLVHVSGSEGSKTLTEIADTTGVKVHETPQTSGGCAIAHLVSAGSTNPTSVKASAGQVYAVSIYNNAATPRYVKFHNTAGTPTAGASIVWTIGVQAGLSRDVSVPAGVPFGTGIAFTTVTGIADANADAVTASDLVIDVFYK